jgi:predicted O-methyltransferase YrrM
MKIAKKLLFEMHRLLSKLGIHVLPVHYYSPVANLSDLETTKSSWARRTEMPGIIWDVEAQKLEMRKICLPFQNEYRDSQVFLTATCGKFGPGFGEIEAQALHGFVRHFKPNRIVEVGSGVSSACLLAALKLNRMETERAVDLTCIEPFPSEALLALRSQGELTLEVSKVQQVDPSVFDNLGEGDLLFIDSSHATKTGSDVNYLYLEILPRLKAGVLIHIHDIFFPYDYSPVTLKTLWNWGETALLRAYMIHNSKIKTIFCMSQMHHDHSTTMKEVFPLYVPEPMKNGLCEDQICPMDYPKRHFPSSIYLRIE